MREWPVIDEPKLCARLTLPDDEFIAFIAKMAQSVPPREFNEEIYEHALGYPWARPASSYLLSAGRVQAIGDLPESEREALLAVDAAAGANKPRFPLLAFGSNGSPETLAGKFSEMPDDERDLLVLAGALNGFDIGAAPLPTYYGALPATIFLSPGTAVRAAVLWVTAAQLTMLAWSELSYLLGRLDGVRFQPDLAGAAAIDGLLVFVSRFGALCVDGDPVAMEAVGASGRTATAFTQEQLLDHVAGVIFGDSATARDLVVRVMEDFATTGMTIATSLLDTSRKFESEHWTPFEPAAG